MPAYRPTPGIRWVVELDGVRLIGPSGVLTRLGYPEAALWDFVSRGIGAQRAIKMIQHIGGFPNEATTSTFVAACLSHWQQLGLVRADDPNGHGEHLADAAL